jgi:hypothetical protein
VTSWWESWRSTFGSSSQAEFIPNRYKQKLIFLSSSGFRHLIISVHFLLNPFRNVEDGVCGPTDEQTRFRVPIVKPTRCTSFSNYFLLHNTLHVSDGLPSINRSSRPHIQRQAYVKQLQVAVSVWHMPVAVCTVLNSWWWTERPSETCRVLCKSK